MLFSAPARHGGEAARAVFIGRLPRLRVVGYQNKGFENSGYNIAATTFVPVQGDKNAMTLGDLVPNEDFVSSSIMFLTPGGATPRVEFGGKQVAQRYVYWTEDDEPEQGAGWYLYADDDGEINQNALVIKAGEGFLVNRSSTEADGTITIPAAL